MNRIKTRKLAGKIITYLLVVVSVAFFTFPIFWMVMTSFKAPLDIVARPPLWVFKPTLFNYEYLLIYWDIMTFIKNSIIVSVVGSIVTVVCGSLAAYALARLDLKRKNVLTYEILSLRIMPPVVAMIPIYLMAQMLNLINTHIILILVYSTFNLPLTVLVLMSFFKEIPIEIEEAAMIDGCTRFQVFIRIVLPLSLPGIIVVTLLCMSFMWNEFLFANILTGQATKTLPVVAGLAKTHRGIAWGQAASVGVVTIIFPLILAFVLRKYLVRGLTLGAVKG